MLSFREKPILGGPRVSAIVSVIKTNVVYGLIAIISIGIVVLLLAEAVKVLKGIGEPIAERLDMAPVIAALVAVVVAAAVIGVACFVIGTAVRTRIGAWSFDKVEKAILARVPGYDLIQNVLRGFAEERTAYPAALVSLFGPGTAVFGLVMEDNADGTVTVFIPSAPTLTVGAVHVVDRERVRMLDAGLMSVTDCVSQWGVGSAKVLAAQAAADKGRKVE